MNRIRMNSMFRKPDKMGIASVDKIPFLENKPIYKEINQMKFVF